MRLMPHSAMADQVTRDQHCTMSSLSQDDAHLVKLKQLSIRLQSPQAACHDAVDALVKLAAVLSALPAAKLLDEYLPLLRTEVRLGSSRGL